MSSKIVITDNKVIKCNNFIDKEVYLLNAIGEHNLSFNVPTVIGKTANSFTMDMIHGKNLNYLSYSPQLLKRIGFALSEWHSQCFRHNKVIKKTTFTLSSYFSYKLNININKFSNFVLDKVLLKEMEILLTERLSTMKLISTYGITHGDFCSNNVLISNNDIYLIDFEKTLLGYQIDDIARFCGRMRTKTFDQKNFDYDTAEKHFLSGYGKIDYETFNILKIIYLLRIKKPLLCEFEDILIFPKCIKKKWRARLYNVMLKEEIEKLKL